MTVFRRFLFLVICFWWSSAVASVPVVAEDSIFEGVAIINISQIEEIIANKLVDEDVGDKIVVDIAGNNSNITLKKKYDLYQAEVVDFSVSQRSRRFTASIAFKADDYSEVIEIKGRYDEILSLPVLSYRFPHSKVITESDVEYIDYKKSKTRHDTVMDANFLIGKELKHSFSKMKPIRKRDLVREQVIARNSIVNMLYKTPFVTLQATGIAMDDGAKGDFVRVKNSNSNKVVKAEVRDNNLVVVSSETL